MVRGGAYVQWRFAPWPRRLGLATTLAASGVLLLVGGAARGPRITLGARSSWAVSLAAVACVGPRTGPARAPTSGFATRDEVGTR